ncbi:EF-P lysine aminoacylase GenX, partial [Candidatus Gottesmanbacteria bacterium]|nr:EF-P lysine aminoacylase GenX [Candidatus Gottesmanbacteria bacterium]
MISITNLRNDKSKWSIYFQKEEIIKQIRNFFYSRKFHELHTPLLVSSVIPESYLEFFTTDVLERDGSKKKFFLTTSPEASIKKALVAGVGNCFEITRSFRNKEGGSHFHLLEFTILEWYRVDANYKDIMEDCENLITYILKKIKKNLKINYQGKIIDLTPPWKRLSVKEAFLEYAGIKYDDIDNLKKIINVAKKREYKVYNTDTWEMIFHQMFFNVIEPKIKKENKPVILYDYPREMAALSQIKKADPRFAERFEFYIGGLELGDCYSELTDYKEQESRFKMEMETIKRLKKTPVKMDKDFLYALKLGMPKASGIAVGVD